jgi:hypothetical protein
VVTSELRAQGFPATRTPFLIGELASQETHLNDRLRWLTRQ